MKKKKVRLLDRHYCCECGTEMVREETDTVVEMVCPYCGFRNLLYLKKPGKLIRYQIEVVTPWGVEVIKGLEKDDVERKWLEKLKRRRIKNRLF